jgi:hypothetical protein
MPWTRREPNHGRSKKPNGHHNSEESPAKTGLHTGVELRDHVIDFVLRNERAQLV